MEPVDQQFLHQPFKRTRFIADEEIMSPFLSDHNCNGRSSHDGGSRGAFLAESDSALGTSDDCGASTTMPLNSHHGHFSLSNQNVSADIMAADPRNSGQLSWDEVTAVLASAAADVALKPSSRKPPLFRTSGARAAVMPPQSFTASSAAPSFVDSSGDCPLVCEVQVRSHGHVFFFLSRPSFFLFLCELGIFFSKPDLISGLPTSAVHNSDQLGAAEVRMGQGHCHSCVCCSRIYAVNSSW